MVRSISGVARFDFSTFPRWIRRRARSIAHAHMKLPRARHRWNLSPRRAVALQRELAEGIREAPLPIAPRLIAGGDCAFVDDGRTIIAAWVVWDLRDACVVEEAHVLRPVRFPYVPGLLSFRETPALLAAARRLRVEPDVFMVDGHGRAHPRRFGIACHVGLLLDRPTIGCAKSRLCGRFEQPEDRTGSITTLSDRDDVIGLTLRTRHAVKPVFISIGHQITLSDACDVVMKSCLGFRLPEPTRLADQLVNRIKKTHGP